MKRKLFVTTAAILFAASTAAFAADNTTSGASGQSGSASQGQSQQSNHTSGQSQATAGQQQKAPDGFVLVEENTVVLMANEPQQHLVRAHEQLAANNPKAAAAEIRLTEAYLKMQEARPGNQNTNTLTQCQQQLNDLAGRVQKGDVKPEELSKASAEVDYTLAKYYDQRSSGELSDQHKQVQAGYDLQAAADNFEQALIWNIGSSQAHTGNSSSAQQTNSSQANGKGQLKVEQQDSKAIADARIAAAQLIVAENWASSGQNSGGNAQPAASKSSPTDSSAKGANASSNAQAQDPKQAASELSKAIDGASSQFKGDISSAKADSSGK